MRLDILLATYNGDHYLQDQIESILAQTVGDWRLMIRDDASGDKTSGIIRSYEQRFPGKIIQIDPHGPRLGVIANFSRLMEASTAAYVMLCDQDDIWDVDKIELTLKAMEQLEQQYGTTTPLLVHTDARLVDENLQPISPSFHSSLKRRPECSTLSKQLVRNTAHGCTVMMNRALVRLAAPIPTDVRMHDMWVNLVAMTAGHSCYLNKPTLNYRQHDRNLMRKTKLEGKKIRSLRQAARLDTRVSVIQAKHLLSRCKDAPEDKRDIIIKFIDACDNSPWFTGSWRLLKGYCPHPKLKSAAQLLFR